MTIVFRQIQHCLFIAGVVLFSYSNSVEADYQRPDKPMFLSQSVEDYLQKIIPQFQSADLSVLFTNTFPYSLDNTVFQHNVDNTDQLTELRSYFVTGDIKAMWLRDATNQIMPYTFLLQQDQRLFKLLVGLANTQAAFVLQDPFANAFIVPNGEQSPHNSDQTFKQYQQPAMFPPVFERKFEPDSLASVLKLQRLIIQNSSQAQKNALNQVFPTWQKATTAILQLLNAWQGSFQALTNPTNPYYYYFERQGSTKLDTLIHGVGIPGQGSGMVRTLFRPSDDATTYPYNIPINFMLAYELKALGSLYQIAPFTSNNLTKRMQQTATEILNAIQEIGTEPSNGKIRYSFEIDGNGQSYFIDDANYPSLLSLPITAPNLFDSQIYQQTRSQVLDQAYNPFFFEGEGDVQSGIGSPHTGMNRIWPLSLVTQARTSTSEAEIITLIDALSSASSTSGLIHESYSSSNYNNITREGFAWGNAAFAELIVWLIQNHPDLILKKEKL